MPNIEFNTNQILHRSAIKEVFYLAVIINLQDMTCVLCFLLFWISKLDAESNNIKKKFRDVIARISTRYDWRKQPTTDWWGKEMRLKCERWDQARINFDVQDLWLRRFISSPHYIRIKTRAFKSYHNRRLHEVRQLYKAYVYRWEAWIWKE